MGLFFKWQKHHLKNTNTVRKTPPFSHFIQVNYCKNPACSNFNISIGCPTNSKAFSAYGNDYKLNLNHNSNEIRFHVYYLINDLSFILKTHNKFGKGVVNHCTLPTITI